ncbi:expressed unknown protein [Seminavis robusta]|uniref:Uncharacterized protein n=1 Tax=Seminavis robusta TaxID=568900 RepID=A0A9N8E425_9STRA|nr:expressed unknown protein [Seminavis robusta]|eukprot:Sro481_g151550.1 n/a (118) ;mRNA; r:26859-27316
MVAAGFNWIDSLNTHDPERLKTVVTESCMVVFAEQELPFSAYLEEVNKISGAFPDFHIDCPNGFKVEYDKQQRNDPETYYFYVNDEGKVWDFQIEAKEGDMTGPAGLYQQIGGFPIL